MFSLNFFNLLNCLGFGFFGGGFYFFSPTAWLVMGDSKFDHPHVLQKRPRKMFVYIKDETFSLGNDNWQSK